MRIVLATWNIYFFGNNEKVERTPHDLDTIAGVIDRLAPDVLALEEIVDPNTLESVLASDLLRSKDRDYVIRTEDGSPLCSQDKPFADPERLQKVFLCVNRATVDVVRAAPVHGVSATHVRLPFAAHIRHRSSAHEMTVVAAHLRSGFPDFHDAADASVRFREADAIRRWIGGESTVLNPEFPRPETADIAVLGDFNYQLSPELDVVDSFEKNTTDPRHSLDPLRKLTGWTFENAKPGGANWETALYEGDQLVIDFILMSPSLAARATRPPTVYAWDYDEELGGGAKFHVGPNGTGYLKGYGVSDHRPVYAEFGI